MKNNQPTSRMQLWLYVGIFILAVVLVYLFLPQSQHQNRSYEIGKPWQYELLTAPYDFPIYKSDNEIKKEQDSILQYYIPYFYLQSSTLDSQLVLLAKDGKKNQMPETYTQYFADKLTEIYQRGLIAGKDMDNLNKMHISKVYVVGVNKMANEIAVPDLFTKNSALQFILNGNSQFNDSVLSAFGIDNYLTPNLQMDEDKSNQAKIDLLNRITLKSGMVQAGERIIDRGEIVTPRTYKILNSYQKSVNSDSFTAREHLYMKIGLIVILVGLFTLLFLYLYFFTRNVFSVSKNVMYILLMQLSVLFLASLTVRFTNLSIYLIPFCMLPIMVRTFFDSRTALFTHIITILIASLMVSVPFDFILLQITAGFVSVATLKQMSRRSQLVKTLFFVFLAYSVMYFGISLVENGSLLHVDWVMFGYFAVNSVLLLFAYGLIYIFERLFGFLSDVSLVELATLNSNLMMEFAEKAPGSFQHVLQVSNLAIEAAKKINANMLLVRTGALYHDIGKMQNPTMFTENQHGVNPLLTMSFEDAAQVVIKHVPDGVRLAQKKGLPQQIIDFITQHHGTSKARYFYNSYKNAYPDREIDESKFTYPGPNPTTKESAIVLMADAVEASSRSLKEYSYEIINDHVEKIINFQVSEGLLNNAPITFKEVGIVKEVFKEKLQNMYHTRISYPELKKPSSQNNEKA